MGSKKSPAEAGDQIVSNRALRSEAAGDGERPFARTAGLRLDEAGAGAAQIECGQVIIFLEQIGHFQRRLPIVAVVAPGEAGIGNGEGRQVEAAGYKSARRQALVADVEARRDRAD